MLFRSGTTSFSSTSGQLFSVSDGMSGTIFSINDISGIPLIETTSDGNIKANRLYGYMVLGTNTPIANSSSKYAMLSMQTRAADIPGIIVKAYTSQTANLQEWQNSSGTTLTSIDANGGLTIVPNTTSNINLILKRSGNQSANLQEWQNNDGTIQSAISTYGGIGLGGNPSTSTYLAVYTRAASIVGAIIKGAASQTANLQEWQNSSGTVLANIDPSGSLILNKKDVELMTIMGAY